MYFSNYYCMLDIEKRINFLLIFFLYQETWNFSAC